ncbi:hypothetical protein Tco_0386217 [Tanacetum coccineum]
MPTTSPRKLSHKIHSYPFLFPLGNLRLLQQAGWPLVFSLNLQTTPGVQSTSTYRLRPLLGFSHHPSKAPIFDPGSTKSHHFSVLSSHPVRDLTRVQDLFSKGSNKGPSVKQKPDGIFISQDKYVADILKKFDFCSIKTATTPIASNKPLVKDEDGVDVDVHVYRSMIGSLMYLTASRPDIMFVVCACARDSPFELEAFSDSDYGGASLDRKSTTEYVAATNCCGQVLWIQNQMMDYGFNFMNTKIHIDNESTICIVKNPVYHSRTKHIEIRHHFIRDCYEKRLIDVIKIHTDANVADLLTIDFR